MCSGTALVSAYRAAILSTEAYVRATLSSIDWLAESSSQLLPSPGLAFPQTPEPPPDVPPSSGLFLGVRAARAVQDPHRGTTGIILAPVSSLASAVLLPRALDCTRVIMANARLPASASVVMAGVAHLSCLGIGISALRGSRCAFEILSFVFRVWHAAIYVVSWWWKFYGAQRLQEYGMGTFSLKFAGSTRVPLPVGEGKNP